MKQRFSLEEYLADTSRKVVTRDGHSVRILCTDAKGDYPVVGLIYYNMGSELAQSFTKEGIWCEEDGDEFDLFFATEKKDGWVNVYKLNEHYMRAGDLVFKTKEEAMKSISSEDYVATTHIEWEEQE